MSATSGSDRREQALALFADGGRMGAALAALDWSATPLGPVEDWPQSLRSSVSLCLASRAPMMVVWGPEHIQLYNDALAPLMGPKHPAALGRPYAESFAEIWDDVMGPLLAGVYERAESSYLEDLPVSFHRRVPDEEMFWTFSWSPLRDESGRVAGALHPAVETTGRVLAERRLQLLRDLAASAGQAVHVQEACDRAVAVFAEHRADVPSAAIYLLEDVAGLGVPVTARRVATSGAPEGGDDFPPEIDLTEATFTDWPLAAAASSGRPQVVETGVVLPLLRAGQDRPSALLALVGNPRRPMDAGQLSFLELLAGQLATSLASAALHEQQYAVALALQRAMLPDSASPSSDLLDVSARYAPGTADVEVGGDWYDVVPLGAGRTALVIGDVMGRGVHAAAVMGQLRAAVRAYAQLDLPPERVLDLLGRLVEHVSEARDVGQIVTCVYAVHDSGDQTLTLASAGHPPPVLFGSQCCATTEGPVGPPLGTGHGGYEAATLPFGAGAGLLLYTDGLIERRDSDIDVGIARLVEVVRVTGAEDLERLADAAMAISYGSHVDDVALLAVRVPQAHLPLPFVLQLADDPRAARTARHATTEALRLWGVDDEVAYSAAMLVSELVNNAVTHSGRPRQLRLRQLTDRLVLEVSDGDPRPPRPVPPDLRAEGGRGLMILGALSSGWGVRYDGTGKIVWCEVLLGPTG